MHRDWDLTETLRQAAPVKVTREGLEAMREALLAHQPAYQPPTLSAETLQSVRDQVLAMTPTYQPPIFSTESLAQQYARLIRGESDRAKE